MRKIILLPAIAVFIAIISVPTYSALAVSTITFDSPAVSGDVITTQYENDGVLFAASPDAHIFLDSEEATSKDNILVPAIWDQTRSGNLDFSIVDPSSHNPSVASSVSFHLISIGMNPVTVKVYDSGNNEISHCTQTIGPQLPNNGLDNDNLYTCSDPSISRVTTIGNGQGGDGYGIDNLLVTFGESPQIPEFPIPFSMIIIFAAVAAVYMGIRQKMLPGFKSF